MKGELLIMNIPDKKDKKYKNNIIYNRLLEAYRTLVTNVNFVSIQKEIKSIVLTSGNRNEGKSTVAANFGISLAERGIKTIIVDCDLRNPTQQDIFDVKNDYGLTEVLMGHVSLNEALKITAYDNLFLLTAGLIPPNPTGMLNSLKMTKLIDQIKKDYDMILFDTCPLGIASDPSIMSAMADGTILIIRANSTNRDIVNRSVKVLELAKANILGVVLNSVEYDNKDDYYYYGY